MGNEDKCAYSDYCIKITVNRDYIIIIIKHIYTIKIEIVRDDTNIMRIMVCGRFRIFCVKM